jgi:glycosyltransferase
MNTPLITIITVAYNAVKDIENTILSVLNQTYPNIEYIIIDGGSTDGTLDIIKKYEDKISYWVSEPDKGIYDAMNKGVAKANGDYLFFLGADDKIVCDFNEIVHFFKDKNTVYYGDVLFGENGKRYDGAFDLNKLLDKNISHQAIFYSRNCFLNNSYNLKYKLYADYEMNIRLWNNFKFVYINNIITIYGTEGASSLNRDLEFKKDFPIIIYRNFGFKHLIKKIVKKINNILFIKNDY